MRNRYSIMLFCLALLIGFALPTFAAEKRRVEVKARNAAQSAEHRIALVIGNANYRIGALRNPANDARAIAAALRDLGFEVDEQINLSYQEMGRAVNRFGKGIRKDSVALFYYAGHGLQVQGSNYLVPVDMEIQDEGEVQFNTVNAGQVLAKMEEAKNPVNIVILDACRDNPYARGFKRSSGSRGLAAMDAPVGSFVAYAAAPGKTADDGKGKNGLYTESLIRQIRTPGMKIEDVFKRVRTEVRSKSNGSQVPEERSSLEGDFYFAKGSMVVEETPAPPAVREPATGRLTVKSNISGAKVYIDGAYEGDTPHTATLKPGAYSIILKKAGYPDAAEDVRVEGGGAKTISIVMEKPAPPPVAAAKTGDIYQDSTTGMDFVFVKGGCYEMGDTFGDGRADEKSVHNVCINDFYLGKYEVTVGQFRTFVQDTNYRTEAEKGDGCFVWSGSKWEKDGSKSWRSPGFSQDDNLPAVCVSWNDSQAFNEWLSRKGGKSYRLPTEAEWEYAARSGGKKEKYAGTSNDSGLGEYAWYNANSGNRTHAVGEKTPNGLGLYDMTGNVWEWCQDWYGEKYYEDSPRNNPQGPSNGQYRVLRGGAWFRKPENVRAATRTWLEPAYRNSANGFRLSLSAP
jgi:formylglycine-generating enzyme required for sulfatase activity